MAAASFARALSRVLVYEGGRADDPHDPGGRTAHGVTQRVYDAWRDRRRLPHRDVWTIEPAEVAQIYRTQYWDRCGCDELPAGLDFVVFDGAVNSGCTQSVKWLQRALGLAPVDGVAGQVTLAAAAAYPDPATLVVAICRLRLAFMHALTTWDRYGAGWSRRVADVKACAIAWCDEAGAPPPAPAEVDQTAPVMARRALIGDARPIPSTALGDGAAGGGTLAATLSGVQSQLQPLAGTAVWIDRTIAATAIAGGLVAVAGLAWSRWARLRGRRIHEALDLPMPAAASGD
jgi:lysozyme family protein